MNTLTQPSKPYASWSKFLTDLWMHGMCNMDKGKALDHARNLTKPLVESFTRRNEASNVRPSSFLACARQTYFSVQGHPSGDMPANIGSTFAVGHLLHEFSFAACRSAAPKELDIASEINVDLPKWWPKDETKFNQSGHIDMLCTWTDEAAKTAYLGPDAPMQMIVDFKTMGSFSYKKHGKTVWGEDPDGFGYLGQVAVYCDALGLLDSGAIIAGINRDQLTAKLLPRWIEPAALRAERDRVKMAIDMAVRGEDPGEEFLVRHDDDAHFFCGRNGKPGYCPFRDICREQPTR